MIKIEKDEKSIFENEKEMVKIDRKTENKYIAIGAQARIPLMKNLVIEDFYPIIRLMLFIQLCKLGKAKIQVLKEI